MDLRFELVDEFRITGRDREQIRALLNTCFPDAEFTRTRSYLKQIPGRRLLAWDGDIVVGHAGIEHRVIGLSTGPAQIFGLLEVCVAPELRSQGIASAILSYLEQLGRGHDIEFLVLFADDERLYLKHGYRRPGNRVRWTRIDEHETLGLGDERVEALMILELGDRPWPGGPIDLLGYLF